MVFRQNSGAAVPLYFGCWGQIGHYFYLPSGASAGAYAKVKEALPWDKIDGTLNPSSEQGEAAIHLASGWTALAWADRSVDTRPGSNSVAFLPGTLSFAEAVSAARVAFPSVMRRQPVPLWDTAEGRAANAS